MRYRMLACVIAVGSCFTVGTAFAAETGTAKLMDAEGKPVGSLDLRETPFGVLMKVKVSGLPAGVHAVHIHDKGKCEPPFESAGGHYNPDEAQHGLMNEQGPHVGDMPNLHVGTGGTVEVEILNPMVTLTKDSENTLLDEDGSSVVIHAGADDYVSDPAGNAGGRLVCGVIEGQSQD